MSIEAFGHTDIGKKRERNEDNYICYEFKEPSSHISSSLHLVAVADGMGGHMGGERASALAIRTLKDQLVHSFAEKGSLLHPKSLLEDCLRRINREIFYEASQDEDLVGMGTTLVAALISPDQAFVANVGDSRAYLIRGGSITQITSDHTWKAEQLRAKSLSEEDINNSPFKSLVTRSLGFQSDVDVDTFEAPLREGDYLLLCSDGLYKSLGSPQILKPFRRKKDPQKICLKLVRSAYRKGGQDNITAVVVLVREKKNTEERAGGASDTIKIESSG